jgi:glutaminyl-peptide cyclotransferase
MMFASRLSHLPNRVRRPLAKSAVLKGHGFSRVTDTTKMSEALAAEEMRNKNDASPQGLKPNFSWASVVAQLKLRPFKANGRCIRDYLRFAAAFGLLFLFVPAAASAQTHFSGAKALEYAREFAAIGPRWPTGPGHVKAEEFLRNEFKHDQVEEDTFTSNTPIGPVAMRNFIVRFPGKKNGVIVLGTHYETNYPLRNINFVGANDGAATTGLLLAIADQLRSDLVRGKTLDGYSVWLVFFDGEEAFQTWSASDSTYGSRHLAAKWGRDGTLPKIKAFMLADMIGDKDLDIQRESRSTDWLVELVRQAAHKFGYEKYFFQTEEPVDDDHLPFVQRGVPSIDVIDLDYGPNNSYHHTAQDTMDKISARSLTIDGDVFMETIRQIDLR